MTRKPPETYAQTRRRLHSAILTVSVGPPGSVGSPLTCWPAYQHEYGDWWEAALAEVRAGLKPPSPRLRFQPSRDEIDDCLVALAWLRPIDGVAPPLEPWQWRMLHLRAWQEVVAAHRGPRKSWNRLGDALADEHGIARSDEWWRGQHNDLVARAYACATFTGEFRKALGDLAISGQKEATIAGRVRAA